jgi:hypothetical protein
MTRRTKKIAIISTLITTAAVGLISTAFYVVQARGNALIREYDLLREQAATQNRLDTTFGILELSASERAVLNEYFLTERGIISFIAELEGWAQRKQVTFETTQLAVEPAADGKPALLKIGFSFSSSLPRTVRFMELLEAIPYHKQIVTAQITSTPDQADTGDAWQGNIIMHLTLIP